MLDSDDDDYGKHQGTWLIESFFLSCNLSLALLLYAFFLFFTEIIAVDVVNPGECNREVRVFAFTDVV